MKQAENISDGSDDSDRLARYKEEIAYYEKESGAWHDKSRKILKRYKDERSPREQKIPRFNILYSNISTLLPAVYGKNPKPDIERRFKDDDSLGRVTSEILERCSSFFVESEAFRSSMRNALFDRLTCGRGVVWTRYVPHFKDIEPNDTPEEANEGVEITDDVSELSAEIPDQEVGFEEAITDYVHWQDFGHNWARTYDEIYLIWRKVFLTRRELKVRFGKAAKDIPLDYYPKGLNDQKKDTAQKKAVIYEIWDDAEKRVSWIHKDCEYFLDDKDDPLKLDGFFPCPKPLYGVLANDSMIPVPDYMEYQDQALELDELTSRIASITKCLKIAGVYDASAPALERLLAEGCENKLLPVEQWAIFAEKGGIGGAISFLPVKEIMETLLGLYEARDKVKADLYEITGIADIIRGNSDPNETATAVKTKSNFATIRLSDAQDDMARFARDAVKNVCVVIATHFSIDTIKKISGMKLLTAEEKQQTQMQQQQTQQQYQQAMQLFQQHQQMQPQVGNSPVNTGQQQGSPQPQAAPPPAPPPLPDKMLELMDNPTWEEVEQLLRNEPVLSFKIDIEIDSTIKTDEQAEQTARVEMLEATAKFISAGIQAGQQEPALMPLFAQMLMFGVRGFKVGKDLEGQFKVAMEKLEKAAANPQPKQSPEMMKVQADIAAEKARAEADKEDALNDAKMNMMTSQQDYDLKMKEMQAKNDLEIQKMKLDFQFKEKEMALQADLDMKKHKITTEAASKPTIQLDTGGSVELAGKHLNTMAEGMEKGHAAMMQSHGAIVQGNQAMLEAAAKLTTAAQAMQQQASKPKTVSMQRADGSTAIAKIN